MRDTIEMAKPSGADLWWDTGKGKHMKEQLTPWFPSSIKPVHIGVYETDIDRVSWSKGFSFWNGKCWGNTEDLPEWALDDIGVQCKKWRGLQEKQA
jgi:hypothetical protein